MPDPSPTPGQVAYAAYCQVRRMPACRAFADLPHYQQCAWEAAAQAVLDAWQAQPRLEETPGDREGHATSCSSYTFRPDAGAASDHALQRDADGRPEGHPPADEP